MEKYIPVLSVLVLILTLYINFLAGSGYVNNITTGEVSAQFPTLFTPAGFTFAIWGLIYVLNVLFVLTQVFKMLKQPQKLDLTLNGLFILICLTNSVWIFTWHLMHVGWALILMLGILLFLLAAYQRVRDSSYGSYPFLLEYINFSVYLGWISVATVANVAIFLTKIGVAYEGTFAAGLTALIITVVLGIAVFMILAEGNIFYGLIILWASYGIIVARAEETLAGAKIVSLAALVSMIAIFVALVYRTLRLRTLKTNKD